MRLVLSLIGFCMLITPAISATPSTFVSSGGSNNNDCSRNLPCRTFARALTQTNAGGEIKVLDPGDYGVLVINKSINIVAEGPGEAAIQVGYGDTAITVNVGPAESVSVRGITIKGRGTGSGILFLTGRTLVIERCVIRDLSGTGILFQPNGVSNLVVSNTIVTNVGARGIHITATSGAAVTVKAVVSHSQVHNTSGIGIFAQGTGSSGTIDMTVSDTVSTGSSDTGMRANSLGGATTTLTIVRSVSANNTNGVSAANPNATVRVGQTSISGNAKGWFAEGSGTLQSYGDNYVDGNVANQGAMPLVARK